MADQLKGKRVPWSQCEDYVKMHKKQIVNFQEQLEEGLMDIPEIEAKLPKSFSQLYSAINKILKENNILPNEEESKVDQLQLIVKTVMKLQSNLISNKTDN